MKKLAIACIALMTSTSMVSMPVWAQTQRPASTVAAQGSVSVIDSVGDLIVFDAAPPVSGITSLISDLTVRITVVRPGGTPESVTYSHATMQVLGVGKLAVYALLTSYTQGNSSQSIIAIQPNHSLPAAASGFSAVSVPSQSTVQSGESDFVSVITTVTNFNPSLEQQIVTVKAQIATLQGQIAASGIASSSTLLQQLNAAIAQLSSLIQQAAQGGASETTSRQSVVYSFDGTTFNKVSTATLPD